MGMLVAIQAHFHMVGSVRKNMWLPPLVRITTTCLFIT